MNKIISVVKVYDYKLPMSKYCEYAGYKLVSEKDTYFVLISSCQNCCERWGYFSTNDSLEEYVGAELLEVRMTDTNRLSYDMNKVDENGFIELNECMFVDFVTNQGVFQLAVYNSHNGYYGHTVLVMKNDEEIEKNFL